MRRPLVIFALILCLGIICGPRITFTFLPVYIFTLVFWLLAFISIKRRLGFGIFLCCFIFFFGAALYKNSRILPNCHIFRYTSYKNNYLYTVKGIVDSQPLFRNNTVSFIFKAKEIQFNHLNYNTCGNILVYVRHKKDLPEENTHLRGLHYGEELILTGNLCRPFKFGGSGRKSYRDYLYDQSIFSVMNVRITCPVVNSGKNRGSALKRFSFRLKERIEGIIFRRVSFVPAAIMDAMILGEKRNIPVLINNSMMKSGTVHILPRLYTKMPSVAL